MSQYSLKTAFQDIYYLCCISSANFYFLHFSQIYILL